MDATDGARTLPRNPLTAEITTDLAEHAASCAPHGRYLLAMTDHPASVGRGDTPIMMRKPPPLLNRVVDPPGTPTYIMKGINVSSTRMARDTDDIGEGSRRSHAGPASWDPSADRHQPQVPKANHGSRKLPRFPRRDTNTDTWELPTMQRIELSWEPVCPSPPPGHPLPCGVGVAAPVENAHPDQSTAPQQHPSHHTVVPGPAEQQREQQEEGGSGNVGFVVRDGD